MPDASVYYPAAPSIEDFKPVYDAADYQPLSEAFEDKVTIVHSKDIDVELDPKGLTINVSKDSSFAKDILLAVADDYESEAESVNQSLET